MCVVVSESKKDTCDSSMDNSSIFELDWDCLIVQLHQKPVDSPKSKFLNIKTAILGREKRVDREEGDQK